MNEYFTVFLLATLGSLLGGINAACQSSGSSFKCYFGNSLTQSNCPSICNWCPSLPNFRKCQTSDRACLHSDRKKEPTSTDEETCENAGFVWCDGDGTQECVQPEPVRKLCFKKFPSNPCPNTHNSEVSCNTDPVGCFWCDEGSPEIEQNRCLKLPVDCSANSCCDQAPCRKAFTQATCEEIGCNYCVEGSKTYCNFGPPPLPTSCPTVANTENCFDGLLSATPTEELCLNMSCVWCSEGGMYVCKRNMYAPTCMTQQQELCAVSGLDSQLACKSWGCEWCGSDTIHVHCQKSTSCTSCSCPDPQECQGSSPLACGLNGCLWCDNATAVGHCINMNSEGVTPGTANNFTECTKTCGGGSQWRFSECSHPIPSSCPREYRTCNDMACPIETCSQGERPRYDDSTNCCQNHTFACGRNPLNENRPPVNRRKKRVVGGMPTGSVEKWPWLDVVYFNLSSDTPSYCPATLIGDKWLITTADCVRDMDPTDSMAHLDVYNRTEAPGIEANIQQFHYNSNFGVVELTTPVTPYSDCVHPLCMPNGEIAQEDRKCVVAGWGRTNASDPASCSKVPHDVTVRVMDWALCVQAWGLSVAGLDPSDHFCAGIPEGGKDFCIKDDGAPLMCQRCENCGWYLAGVATSYTSCGEPMKPGVYYRVDGAVQAWMMEESINLPPDPNMYTSCP